MFHEFIYEFGCTKVLDGHARSGWHPSPSDLETFNTDKFCDNPLLSQLRGKVVDFPM